MTKHMPPDIFLLIVVAVTGCDAQPIADKRGVFQQFDPNPPKKAVELPDYLGTLKAGVALPQTLPDGTAVGFSVDYRFKSYQPDPGARYVWEIRMGDGSVQKLPVQLTGQKGNLSQFLPVRPEKGPFYSRIVVVEGEEQEPQPLTDWALME